MSPTASPGTLTPKTGVRRVNNVPVYIAGVVMTAFIVVIALVAAGRAEQQRRLPDESTMATGNTLMFAEAVTGEYANDTATGMIAPTRPEVIITEPVSTETSLIAPTLPEPELEKATTEPAYDEEAERIRMMKFELFQEAVRAKTTVSTGMMQSSGNGPSPPGSRAEMLNQLQSVRQQLNSTDYDNPTAVYQAKLAQLQGQLNGMSGGEINSNLTSQPTQGNAYEEFNHQGKERWKLNSTPNEPRTAFELRAGFVIPAIMISGINSDLPGQITAQVSQHVYDTPTGRYLLIPQGSRLVGRYSNDVIYGQSRVLIAWQRIIFPDGKAMDIGAMPGADGAGYAGFKDKVNNHYTRVFGSAILMSGIVAGVNISQNDTDLTGDTQRSSDALSEALGQQLGQVTAQIISKNLNIAPTLEIRPGYRFNVIATKDLTFKKPYQSFDYK